MSKIQALSIQQPFAWLIAHGYQDIENRDWKPYYKGWFLIHASGTLDAPSFYGPKGDEVLDMAYWQRLHPDVVDRMPPMAWYYETKGIVGVAHIARIVMAGETRSPWFRGAFGLKIDCARPVPWIPLRGELYFFDVADEIIAQVKQALQINTFDELLNPGSATLWEYEHNEPRTSF